MLRLFKRLFLLSFVVGVVFCAWFAWFVTTVPVVQSASIELEIAPGQGLRQVSRELVQVGVDMEAWQFTLLARLMDKAGAIKAGNYELTAGMTPMALLTMLSRGDVTLAEITLIEGWNLRQVRAALNAHPDLRHDTQALSDEELARQLGVGYASVEGLLYPDTYLFSRHASDWAVLRRAFRIMEKRLVDEWAAREPDTPCRNPYEALILASIVEKETALAADRGKVASVFVNRLRLGMPLQTDPTVIYGLGTAFDGNLRKRDLQQDTPFNTYTRNGLPPGPIAMPGKAALHAALHPERTPYLYFVARGDGSSQFSRDLDSHNRAVALYQRKK